MYNIIKIIIGDEHDCVIAGVAARLLTEEDLRLVGIAGDARQLLLLARQQEPHIIITDIRNPVMDSIQAITCLVCLGRQVKVIAFTHHEEINIIDKIRTAGARGYVCKSSGMDHLIWAIRAVYSGNTYFCPGAEQQLRLFDAGDKPFKPNHLEILPYILDGKSDEEIGKIIYKSPRTIEGRRTDMKERLKVKTNAGIIKKAIEAGYNICAIIISFCTIFYEDQLPDIINALS